MHKTPPLGRLEDIMKKEQFDILVALEKDRLPLDAQALSTITGLDCETVASIAADLTAQGIYHCLV